jgi:RNA polymerase sigma factor (sigma-70 family)
MSDNQIIEYIKIGKDDKAFLVLYKYFAPIKKMIVSKGGKMEDAQDVFQDSLIILHKKIMKGEFRLTSKLSTYLYSVCRYLWKDQLQKKSKNSIVEFNEEIDTAEISGLEEIMEKENRIKIAEKIVSELGERCRELLLLFYSGTLKLKEIALKMGYNSENTAKNQKYKCLESAKRKLQEIQQADKNPKIL